MGNNMVLGRLTGDNKSFLPSQIEDKKKKRSRVEETCYSLVVREMRLSVMSGKYMLLGGVGVICDAAWEAATMMCSVWPALQLGFSDTVINQKKISIRMLKKNQMMHHKTKCYSLIQTAG